MPSPAGTEPALLVPPLPSCRHVACAIVDAHAVEEKQAGRDIETPESPHFLCSSDSAESSTGIWDDVRVFAYVSCGQVLIQFWL